MKETVTMSIAQQAFTIDKDAYVILKRYLRGIRCHIANGDTDTMADIEARIAEIFREKLSSPMLVVSAAVVRETMAQLGDPEDFGTASEDAGEQSGNTAGRGRGKIFLRRSRRDRILAGICGGLAEYFGVEASIIRLSTLMLIVVGGLSIWVYIVLWLIIPDETTE